MALAPGARLGPYDILSALGVGGMGEVYRARDAKLNRDVAIKVLLPAVASEPERLARFSREGQVLASLNHPNIAHIHGLEDSNGVRALVMELVEGPTLADRIAQGPIPLDEALPIARQIAEALEAAHEQGVIHRDLKPANIKVTPDGIVKVLDFGLAKLAQAPGFARPGSDATVSPTITSPAMMTGVGMILGTAAYMSPEQAKGRDADKRSDIWAFGCVLFEMLTGRRPFEGDDMTDVIAAVVRGEPAWDQLPPGCPPAIRAVVRDCLTKDRRRRPGDAAALLFAIDHAFDTVEPGVATAAAAVPSPRAWIAVAIASALLVGGAAAVALTRVLGEETPPQAVARFEVSPPAGTFLPGANGIPRFAVSPDGQTLAFLAGARGNGPFYLWLRRLDRLDAEPLRLTATAADTALQGFFWFPDGSAIGYFDEPGSKLKRVDVQTGAVQTIADVPGTQLSGSVNADGVIILASSATNGIVRVGATGGTPVQVVTPENPAGDQRYLWPRFLPDGRRFLYFIENNAAGKSAVHVGSLDAPQNVRLIDSAAMAEFAPPDRLLYMRGETLLAQVIDMDTFALVGDPIIVAQPVFATAQGRPGFSVSNTGVLVHSTGASVTGEGARALLWVDRNGREQPLGAPPRAYTGARISPDGTRVAVSIDDQDVNLWMWDVARTTLTRVTFDRNNESSPVWTPDSRRIVYASSPSPASLFAIAADGTGVPERLTRSSISNHVPSAISPDGAEVLFDTNTGDAGWELHRLNLASKSLTRLFTAPQHQRFGMVSPDGRWLAYQSSESGRDDVFVRSYPDVDRQRIQVSTNGGMRPRWSKDGRELFFVGNSGGTLMSVSVKPGIEWTAGTPKVVFSHPALAAPFDVSPDNERFLLIGNANSTAASEPAPQTAGSTARLTVVVNWNEELKRRVPAN